MEFFNWTIFFAFAQKELHYNNVLFQLGVRESAINRAMGIRQSKILASEAMRIEQVNKAKG